MIIMIKTTIYSGISQQTMLYVINVLLLRAHRRLALRLGGWYLLVMLHNIEADLKIRKMTNGLQFLYVTVNHCISYINGTVP